METNNLVQVVQSSGLEQTKGQQLLQMFTPFFSRMSEIELKIKSLNLENPQIEDVKIAKEIRSALKTNRIASEKIKDEQKASILIEGRLIDNLNNVIKNTSKLLESKCEEVEKFAEIQEKKRKELLKSQRTELLLPYEIDLSFIDLENMSDESFQQLLENTRLAYNSKQEAFKKAEEERIKQEKTEKERQEKIRLENIKLQKEAKEKEEQLKKERAKVEFEKKVAEEKARKEREAIEAKLQKEAKEKEKLQAEIKAKEEKEAKEKKAILDAEKKLKLAPDKQKLTLLAKTIEGLQMPDLKSEEAKKILTNIKGLIKKLTTYIINESKNL